MEKIIIFGTSSAAVLTYYSMMEENSFEVAAFTVDKPYIKNPTLKGLPVVPFEDVESVYDPREYKMFVAVYASRINHTRALKYSEAKEKGYKLVSFISSQAIIPKDISIGENCFIGEGVICRPFASIDDNVIIMPGSYIGHDSVIHKHCFIAARAVILGAAVINSYCVLGANCTVQDGITVEEGCVLGSGTVTSVNTVKNGIYVSEKPKLLPVGSDKMKNILFK